MDIPARGHEVVPEVEPVGELPAVGSTETKPTSEPPKESPAELEFQKIISPPTEATETTVADNFTESIPAESEPTPTSKSSDPTSGASWGKELADFTNQATTKET